MLKAEQLPMTKSPWTPNCHLLQWLLAKCKHGPVPQHDCEPELFPCAFFVLGQKFGPWQTAGQQICRKQFLGSVCLCTPSLCAGKTDFTVVWYIWLPCSWVSSAKVKGSGCWTGLWDKRQRIWLRITAPAHCPSGGLRVPSLMCWCSKHAGSLTA